jgi:predicted GIY-YIG superfamily endonuclease
MSIVGYAQAPAGAPAGSTGLCKDGTYYSGATKQGACRGHQGVKDWYGAATTTAPAKAASPATSSTKTAAPAAASPTAASASTAAPAGSTGLCKDGTYYSGATKQGACRGHQGVKDWYGAATTAGAVAAPVKPAAPIATPAPAPIPAAARPVPAPATAAPATRSAYAPAAVAAAGGGPGQVWTNASTKVYHCQDDRWYGKTKQGQYMTEADAQAKGFKPDHGKACSK